MLKGILLCQDLIYAKKIYFPNLRLKFKVCHFSYDERYVHIYQSISFLKKLEDLIIFSLFFAPFSQECMIVHPISSFLKPKKKYRFCKVLLSIITNKIIEDSITFPFIFFLH